MPFVLLGCVGLIWGVSYPITAVALTGFDVLTLRCLIQALGASAMLVQAMALAGISRSSAKRGRTSSSPRS